MKAPAKPSKAFHVKVGREHHACYGDAFFLARSAIAKDLGVEPVAVRLWPHRKLDQSPGNAS